MAARTPIEDHIASSDTEDKTRRKLNLILEVREFAESALGLDSGRHYLDYVDLNRRHVVWNVSATPEFSLDSMAWWYPFLGSLTYRGYFAEKDAHDYGGRLRDKGNDVYVGGVDAYSTLGWFTDPVLSTFLRRSEADLAELIFHELAHQKIFVRGDTDFNEAYATALAQEGVRRWLLYKNDSRLIEQRSIEFERETQFVKLVLGTRDRLEELYENLEPDFAEESELERTRSKKRTIIEEFRRDYRNLRDGSWNGYTGYDAWMSRPINNAQLNTIDTYYDWVPAFHRLIEQNQGDLDAFYREVKRMKRMKKEKRHAALNALLSGQ